LGSLAMTRWAATLLSLIVGFRIVPYWWTEEVILCRETLMLNRKKIVGYG